MIPILYNGDEKRFLNNGRGRLSDATRCVVTEERNGIYELELDMPIDGVHFDELISGRLIVATHDDKHDLQPFEIYKRSVPDLNGIVTFYAHHISYKLNGVTVGPFTADSVTTALQKIKRNSINNNPFTFWTDKSTVADFESLVPRNARAMLAGEENSILDVFGSGEYEFDRFTVKLHAARGTDSDCEIRYGKNLTDLNQDTDSSGTFNAVVPYWTNTEGQIVMLPERIIVYEGVEPQLAYLTDHNLIIIRTETEEPIEVAFRQVRSTPMDMSDAFEEAPTAAQLRAAAKARFESGQYWIPEENLTVDFIQLWQTEEYKEYAGLQRVSLCDTVSVFYPQVGIAAVKQKVVRTEYNVLLDRYDSITLGSLQTSLGEQIREGILQDVPTTSMMEEAIKYATDLIRGGLGGYVVMTPGPNGYPQEILIMDTPDVNTAVNVWRFNQGGLGHSSNGYDGPFSDIALTQDGRINASIITTGILNANIIKAGVLSDPDNNTSFNLSTGALNIKKGSINLGSGKFIATDEGRLTSIGGGVIRDPDSNTIFNLDSGLLTIKKGSINLGSGKFIATDAGVLTSLGGGNIQDVTGDNAWNLTTGFFRTQKGQIGDFNIGTSALTYQATNRYVVFSSSGISYNSAYTDNTRRGAELKANRLSFKDRNDESSWSMTERAYLLWETPYYFRINADNLMYLSIDGTTRLQVSAEAAHVFVNGSFACNGNKNRVVRTKNYSDRLLTCYETPTPLFGDIGEAVLDEEGLCYVDLDDIFTETIAEQVEYQVFLQKEGEGDCWIADKAPRYFVIKGTPNLKVAWELKAKQKDFETYRLEPFKTGLEEYTNIKDEDLIENYIEEQEALLYG